MQTVVFSNEKGGVGKTTTAITCAAGMAARGKSVLLIDADAQGHSTMGLGLAKYPGLYDLLVRNAEFKDVIKVLPEEIYGGGPGRLAVLGSNIETYSIAGHGGISDTWILADKLGVLHDIFDLVVIDTAPNPSLLHGVIYLASDKVIYPTLLEAWSFDGLAESLFHRRAVEDRNPITVAGVIPIKSKLNTLEHSENLKSLAKKFGDLVWTPIPDRIVWAESCAARKPVFIYAPDSQAALDAWGLVDKFEAVING